MASTRSAVKEPHAVKELHTDASQPQQDTELDRALLAKFRQYRTYDLDYVIALRVERVTSWGL